MKLPTAKPAGAGLVCSDSVVSFLLIDVITRSAKLCQVPRKSTQRDWKIFAEGKSLNKCSDFYGLQQVFLSFHFNEILNAHRPLTAKTALMFEAALDVPADSLMYLQTKYNLQVARKDPALFSLLKEIKKSSSNILTPSKIAKR